MIYFALLKGCGYGCDHCIDCNITYKRLKATDEHNAAIELEALIKEYTEPKIDIALLIPAVAVHPVDCQAIYEAEEAEIAKNKAQAKKEDRRRAYELLKKEFE